MKRPLLCFAAAFAVAGSAYAASQPEPEAGTAAPAAPSTGATPATPADPGAPPAPPAPSAPTMPPTAPTTNGDPSAPAAPASGADTSASSAAPASPTAGAPTGVGLAVGSQIIDNQGALVGAVTAISNGADGKPVATVNLDDKTFAVPISSLLVQDGKGTINLTRAQIQAMVARASAAPEPAAQ